MRSPHNTLHPVSLPQLSHITPSRVLLSAKSVRLHPLTLQCGEGGVAGKAEKVVLSSGVQRCKGVRGIKAQIRTLEKVRVVEKVREKGERDKRVGRVVRGVRQPMSERLRVQQPQPLF